MKLDVQKLIISLIVLVCTAAVAGVPPASDYDKAPEDVFLDSLALPDVQAPPDISSYPLHMHSHVDILPDGLYAYGKFSYDVTWTTPTNAVDWDTLVQLNHQASEIWNALLACEDGNLSQLRKRYLQAQICPQVAPQMKAFRKSVALFLSTTMVADPSFQSYLKYRIIKNEFESGDLWMEKLNSFDAATSVHLLPLDEGYTPYLTGKKGLDASKYLVDVDIWPMMITLDSLPALRFNPLLIQILMEYVAAGYPLNYGSYTCGGINCLVRLGLFGRSRIVLETDDLHWGLRGVSYDSQDTADRATLLASVRALLGNGPLPNISPDLSVKLQILRQAKIAVRLLNFMAVGTLKCGDWGLWPLASVDLLGILAQSEYQVNNVLYQPTDLKFLAVRLSRACHYPIPTSMTEPNSMDDGGYLGGPEALSRVGGWRALLNRFIDQ